MAAAVASIVVVGALTFVSGASAQAPTPNAPSAPGFMQGGPHGRGGPGGMKGDPANSPLAVAAKALGIDEAALRTELQAGKTIADVATANGVDVNTVIAAIVDAEKAKLAQAVTDGRITQAQADQRLADAQTRATDMVNGTLPVGRGGPRGMKVPHGAVLAVAAKAIGIDEAALRTELQAGKTIADVAADKGVDVNTVIAAIVAEETAKLNQAVTDGKLTQAQADQRLADAQTRATDMVNGTLPQGRGEQKAPGRKGGMHAAPLIVVAKALGMDEAALRTELQAGKTIADVAADKGVDVNTVIAAIVAEETAKLNQAVTDGKLTQAQADQRLADAQTRATDMVNGTLPLRPFGPPRQRAPVTQGQGA